MSATMGTTKSLYEQNIHLRMECKHDMVSICPHVEYPYNQYYLTLGRIRIENLLELAR